MQDMSRLPDADLERRLHAVARRVERAYADAERLEREYDELRAERQRRLCEFAREVKS